MKKILLLLPLSCLVYTQATFATGSIGNRVDAACVAAKLTAPKLACSGCHINLSDPLAANNPPAFALSLAGSPTNLQLCLPAVTPPPVTPPPVTTPPVTTPPVTTPPVTTPPVTPPSTTPTPPTRPPVSGTRSGSRFASRLRALRAQAASASASSSDDDDDDDDDD